MDPWHSSALPELQRIEWAELPTLIVALLILVVFWLGARGAAHVLGRTLDRVSKNDGVNRLLVITARLSLTAIDMRTVRLRTVQGNRVLLPNKEVYNGALTNFTETPHRRIDLEVGVAYGDDLKLAKEVCEEAISALACTLVERGVDVFYTGFGDSSINFEARFWINFSRQRDFVSARSEAVIAIKQALDANGLHIPFPIRTLDFGARDVGGWELELLGAGVEGRSAS